MTEEELFQRGLLGLCEDVHGTVTGSFGEYDEGGRRQAARVAYLTKRLAEWKPSTHSGTENYDQCVRALVTAALLYAKRRGL